MHRAGVSKAKQNADGSYTFAYNKSSPITLNREDSEKLMKNMGWDKMSTSIDKACSHMGGIINKIDSCKGEAINFFVNFEHSWVAESTRSVWRTKFDFKNGRKFTIIEGISGLGGKYAVMSSLDAFSSSKGFSKLEDAIKYIFENSRDYSVMELLSAEELQEIVETSPGSESAKDAVFVLNRRKKIKEAEAKTISNKEESDKAIKELEDDIKQVKDITAGLY